MEAQACGACWAHGRGLPRPLAAAAARLPRAFAGRLRQVPSRLATALAARAIGAEREGQVQAMIASADRIVAVSNWLAEALLANGVPAGRLTLSRQGVPDALAVEAGGRRGPAARSPYPAGPPALLYLGRWDPVKGVDVLVRAVRAARADLRLTVRGIAQGEADEAYAARVRGHQRRDHRPFRIRQVGFGAQASTVMLPTGRRGPHGTSRSGFSTLLESSPDRPLNPLRDLSDRL